MSKFVKGHMPRNEGKGTNALVRYESTEAMYPTLKGKDHLRIGNNILVN